MSSDERQYTFAEMEARIKERERLEKVRKSGHLYWDAPIFDELLIKLGVPMMETCIQVIESNQTVKIPNDTRFLKMMQEAMNHRKQPKKKHGKPKRDWSRELRERRARRQ